MSRQSKLASWQQLAADSRKSAIALVDTPILTVKNVTVPEPVSQPIPEPIPDEDSNLTQSEVIPQRFGKKKKVDIEE